MQIGIWGEMLNIIRSMYSCTKSFVKACNTQSEPFVCNLGVRQGECLSPFVCAMYINDLEDYAVVMSSAYGLVGTGFASRYRLQPRAGF